MSSITQFVPTRMVVGDIAEATLMAIATAPDKRVALGLLHTLCRNHAISESAIAGGKTWDASALGDDVLPHFFREHSPNVAVEVHLKCGTAVTHTHAALAL